MKEVINYADPKTIETLKQTVAVGATDAEFRMFAAFCESTGLNPFKKEIWFIKTKDYTKQNGEVVPGKVQMMTGINGYLAIANSHPQFDGMECEIERDDNGKPIRAIAKVHRKDRKFPSVGEAPFAEYYQRGREYKGEYKPTVWDSKPSIMIAKVAKSIALREAFPQELGGTYTEDELGEEVGDIDVTPVAPIVIKPVEPTFYRIEAPTKEQTLFMSKRGEYVESLGAWCVSRELEPRELEKLSPYKVTLEDLEAQKAQSAALIAQVEPVGEPRKVEREETPLEKAKKRVTKMLEGTGHEVI